MTESLKETSRQNKNYEKVQEKGLNDIFLIYKERYQKERNKIQNTTRSWLSDLVAGVKESFQKNQKDTNLEEKPVKYDDLKLSLIAQEYLDTHREELVQENNKRKEKENTGEDKSCIIIYSQPGNGLHPQSKKLWIPRSNPKDQSIKVGGFILSLVSDKSNGYNTEYSIKDEFGNKWTQLAILFPAENPEYNEKLQDEKKLTIAENKLQELHAKLVSPRKTQKQGIDKIKIQSEIQKQKQIIIDLRTKAQKTMKVEKYTYFSYIPYRKELDQKDVHKNGFEYLSSAMIGAYKEQVGNKSLGEVRSHVSRNMTIEKALPWQYPLILNIIERMDFKKYFDKSGKTLRTYDSDLRALMDQQIEKALTLFGANTTGAYNWQRSEVGALGVGQIIPSSYRLFRGDEKVGFVFPESDFNRAAKDHKTSFRFQVSHLDNELRQLPPIIKQNWDTLNNDPTTRIGLIALLSAGYNGSMSRVLDEVFGDMSPSERSSLGSYKKRLIPKEIRKNMEIAYLKRIEGLKQSRKYTQEQRHEFSQRYLAMYKESMTYVLKAEHVWGYLEKNYSDSFEKSSITI